MKASNARRELTAGVHPNRGCCDRRPVWRSHRATNQWVAWVRDRQTSESERARQARLRQEKAHDDVINTLGEEAADLANWIDFRCGQTVVPDFEYYKHQAMKPRLQSDGEAWADSSRQRNDLG